MKRVRVLLTKLRYTNRDILTNLLTSPSPRIQFSGDFSPPFGQNIKITVEMSKFFYVGLGA